MFRKAGESRICEVFTGQSLTHPLESIRPTAIARTSLKRRGAIRPTSDELTLTSINSDHMNIPVENIIGKLSTEQP